MSELGDKLALIGLADKLAELEKRIRALEQAKRGRAMTNNTQSDSDNDVTRKHPSTGVEADKIKGTQELDEILRDNLTHDEYQYTEKPHRMKQAILDWHNKQVEEVLDRLESELNEQKKAAETNLAYHTDVTKNERLVRDWQGTVHGIEFCRPALKAERAKLKEVK